MDDTAVLTVGVLKTVLKEEIGSFRREMDGRFEALTSEVNGKFVALEKKMMEGFEIVFDRFDAVDRRFDVM